MATYKTSRHLPPLFATFAGTGHGYRPRENTRYKIRGVYLKNSKKTEKTALNTQVGVSHEKIAIRNAIKQRWLDPLLDDEPTSEAHSAHSRVIQERPPRLQSCHSTGNISILCRPFVQLAMALMNLLTAYDNNIANSVLTTEQLQNNN